MPLLPAEATVVLGELDVVDELLGVEDDAEEVVVCADVVVVCADEVVVWPAVLVDDCCEVVGAGVVVVVEVLLSVAAVVEDP